ncbi:TPA: DUF4573 domain-containing protein [Streptococcus pyogenes]
MVKLELKALQVHRAHVVTKACKVPPEKMVKLELKVHKVKPARKVHKVKPARKVHKVKPARKVRKVKPARKVHKAKPARKVQLVRTAKTARMAKMAKTVNQVNQLLKHQRSLKTQILHHILQKPLRSLVNQKT